MIDIQEFCKTEYDNIFEKIRTVFSFNYVMFCYNEDVKGLYKKIFEEKSIRKLFNNLELMKSVETFFYCNLNLSQSAKTAFLHRNTLSYRIKTIQKITGLNIKNFEDAIIFQNMIKVKQLLY